MKAKIIFVLFLLILIIVISGCVSNVPSQQQEETAPSLNYNADTTTIKSELQAKNYNVPKVDLTKNPNGFYVLSVAIDTKGSYDKEVLEAYRIMHKNSVADYYQVVIIDYEIQSSYSFVATKKTLDGYLSGTLSEDDYIDQVEVEKLI